ncbi:CLIP domain-containing serine protease 14D-like [Athalia rosae]|uniref:CLIP domain-containing serine protease 14D-like n=1 Tax=Athalia rosae TaxID=37344 RepID=UPI0020340E2A|nr:CLIP domain-containing serine protease 14D-like [Athalia rosae]
MHPVILAAVFFLARRAFADSETCTTYEGTIGICVNIKQCPFLLDLLKRGKLSSNVWRRLSKSQCGFERLDPKVCCSIELSENEDSDIHPQPAASAASSFNTKVSFSKRTPCKTATGIEGSCVSADQCPALYAILNQQTSVSGTALQILKQSLCGFEKMIPKVCCGEKHHSESGGTQQQISSQSHLITPNHSALEHCVTPNGVDGVCVNIKKCRPLFTLLKRSNQLSYQTSQSLKELHCGFEKMDPKVCCENENSGGPQSLTSDQNQIPLPPNVSNHPNLGLLEHEICGPIPEAKIIGGTKTAVFEFPWMALIAYDAGSGLPEFRCGGSLITKKHILTAGHCVATLPPDLRLVGVRLGEYDLSKEKDCDTDIDGFEINCAEDYQDFSILGVAVHPDYPKDKHQDDIALVMLDGEADFQAANVRPICLPIGPISVLNSRMIVTGWGATESGPRSQTLRKVTLPIIPYEDCASLYKLRNIKIWYKQICAGGSNRSDSCSGDSGGPLQTLGMYNGQPRNILYGIVSFGPRDCGLDGVPGVYTKVEYYMDWILDTIGTEIYP